MEQKLIAGSYDFNDVMLSVGGIPISGFADGSAIAIAYDGDLWTDKIGAGGAGTRSKNNDRRATITIQLNKQSLSNSYLDSLRILDETTGKGAFVLGVTHVRSGTKHTAAQAWIMKNPDTTYEAESTAIEWKIRCMALIPKLLGSAPNPAG